MTSSKRHSQDIAQVVNPPSSSKKRTFWGGRRAGTPLAQGDSPPSSIEKMHSRGSGFFGPEPPQMQM